MPESFFKWAGLLFGVVTVAWAVYQWDEHRHAPKVTLYASAVYGTIVKTPEALDLAARLHAMDYSNEWLTKPAASALANLKPGPHSKEVVEDTMFEYARTIQASVRESLLAVPAEPGGYYFFQIHNAGSLTAAAVGIDVPHAVEMVIPADRAGATPAGEGRQVIKGHEFNLGDFAPQHEVDVMVYVPYSVSYIDLRDVKLYFKDGVGEIRDATLHPGP